MIHTRGTESSDAEIVWTQILQGIGGGFAATAAQVGAQASVTHVDVGIITAVVLLWTEIGGAVGSAIGTFSPSSFVISCSTAFSWRDLD